MLLRVLFVCLEISCLVSCQKEENSTPHLRTVPGEIQVLNSCGIPKVASQVRDLLINAGFDVVEVGNANHWDQEETIIALRNPHWTGGEALGQLLGTQNIIPLENPLIMVDATIFIGKDIQKVLQP